MPTAKDFEAFHEDQVLSWTTERYQQHLQERFPTEEDQVAYEFWALRRTIEKLKKSESIEREDWNIPRPRKPLLDMLETINYNSPDARFKAVSELTSSDPIPVGKDANGDFYRIIPRPKSLLADQPHPATSNELVDENILGVNFNVQPPKPAHCRTADLPEQNTVSNKYDNPGEGGFVFFQLGRVQSLFVDDDEEVQSLQDAWEGYWTDTKFCAAMRITECGIADGVYLFCHFHAPGDSTRNRFPEEEGQYWGYLEEGAKQFSCARIADRLSDLGLFKTLSLTEVVDCPVEIVRAVMTTQGTMIRATVALNS